MRGTIFLVISAKLDHGRIQRFLVVTGRYPIGGLGPGGWMRPISGSGESGATSDLSITAGGQTLDFYLSPKRNVAAAKRFLATTLRSNTSAGFPRAINTDKAPSLTKAISELKAEGVRPQTAEHRQVKYLQQHARR